MVYRMTDQDLRKAIFDLLGWKMEVKDHLIYTIRPDGYHYPSDLFWPNAWAYVPDWLGSVDAAIKDLVEQRRFKLEHNAADPARAWHAHIYSTYIGTAYGYCYAPKPARAISEAWYRMRMEEMLKNEQSS